MTAAAGAAAGSTVYHYVYDADDNYTGHRFESVLAASNYAGSIGGSTSTEAPEGFE